MLRNILLDLTMIFFIPLPLWMMIYECSGFGLIAHKNVSSLFKLFRSIAFKRSWLQCQEILEFDTRYSKEFNHLIKTYIASCTIFFKSYFYLDILLVERRQGNSLKISRHLSLCFHLYHHLSSFFFNNWIIL